MEGIAKPWPEGSREENIPRVQREPGPGVGGEPAGALSREMWLLLEPQQGNFSFLLLCQSNQGARVGERWQMQSIEARLPGHQIEPRMDLALGAGEANENN